MSNFEIINNDSGKIPVWDPKFIDITLEAGEAIDYPAGQVLAFNATTGNYEATDSATAAIANAKAVLAQDVSFAGAEAQTNRRALVGGEVDETKLVFLGADDLETIPAGAADSFRLQLRDYGIIARPSQVMDELDNQP